MRQKVLLRSVCRCLGMTDTTPVVVVMWFTHRWAVPYAVVSAIGVAATAVVVGVANPASIGALGMVGAAVATMAATEYRIFAYAESELIMLRSGRVRQVATRILERLPPGTTVERLGGNLVTSEWRVADRSYSTYHRSDMTLMGIAASLSGA